MTKKSFLAGVIALMISGAAMNAQVGVNTDLPNIVATRQTDTTAADGFLKFSIIWRGLSYYSVHYAVMPNTGTKWNTLN